MSRADDHFEMDEWLDRYSAKQYKIMIVEFNSGGASFIPVQQASSRQTGSAAAASDDSSVSFSSQSWQASIKQASAARPEKVAQATALANDPSYPSDADLNRLAGFLSSRL
ncbi:MAG: hypothetical protein ABSH48_14500 [Verrucomicrobiota bacterium]|jgi:hypothetical protein